MFNSATELADFVEIYPNTFFITNMTEFAVKYENIKKVKVTGKQEKIVVFNSKNISIYCYILLASKKTPLFGFSTLFKAG